MEGTYACLTNVDNDQQEREKKLEECGKCVNNITKVLVKKKNWRHVV